MKAEYYRSLAKNNYMLGSHKSYHIINHMHVYLVPTSYRTSIDRINLHQTLALSNFLS